MRVSILLALFTCCSIAIAEQPEEVPVVSACDLLARPEQFDGRVVEVDGRINVQFESMVLVCADDTIAKAPLLFGIWLRIDLDSIKKRSPQFFEQIAEGYHAARRWKGGLIGEMRFRGRFTLSKEWEPLVENGGPRQRMGFGHLGMYGAEVVVEEVLSYRSTIKKPNQSLEPTTMLGTSAAEQPLVPSTVVAHL